MPSIKHGKSKRLTIQLSEPINEQLSLAAKKSGVSKAAYVRVALERELTLEKELERDIKSREPTLI